MANKHWMQPSKDPLPEDFFVVPFDARFPNQNQTRNCFQNYLDYHRCHHKYGEDHAPCEYFQKVFKSICPMAWVEKWDDQRAEGKFPGNLTGSGR